MRFFTTTVLLVFFLWSDAQSLKVMTYNIRFDNPADSLNVWPNRAKKVADLIRKYNPDVIGVQEALHHQLQDLVRLLPAYTYCGVGRDDGKEEGEYSAIFFRNNRFGLLDSKTIWLSETPSVAGSKDWDAALPRILTLAKLYDKELKSDFVVLNTHLDHIGKESRFYSANLIAGVVSGFRKTENKNTPIILTGDFNFERTETEYLSILEGENLSDTKPPNDHTGTYCGFDVDKMKCKTIDYIFHTKEWILKHYQVATDNDGVYYPSDHLPVLTEFELTSEK